MKEVAYSDVGAPRKRVHACPEKIMRVLPRTLIENEDGDLMLLLAARGITEKIECDCGYNPKLPKKYADLGKVATGCRSKVLPPYRFGNQPES